MRLTRRSLPITSPCDAPWNEMARDGQRRFCDRCDKHVHDLAGMTEAEVRDFVHASAGREVCVRYRVGRDGALRYASPAPAVAKGFLVAAAGLLAACAGWDPPESLNVPEVETCRDSAGYVISCEDADATIPDELPPAEAPVEEGVAGEIQGGVVGGVEGGVMGAMVVDVQSCPLPPPPVPPNPSVRQYEYEGEGVLLGAVASVGSSYSVETDPRTDPEYLQRYRAQKRAERRERRHARRQARRDTRR